MSKIIIKFLSFIIKFYKYFFSPLLGARCRYLPSCSEYFLEALEIHGLIKGSLLGFKRILKCHPFKVFGGSSGLDMVPNKKNYKGKI